MSNCPICSGSSLETIFDQLLLRCSKCGHGVANLNLEELDLSKVYTAEYFKGNEYDDYISDELGLRKNFKKRLSKFIKGDRKGLRFFEIGSAHGFFGKTVKEWDPQIEYTGIDVSEDAIEWGKKNLKLDLHTSDFLYYNDTSRSSPTHVFMWDVIEHLKYPEKYIEKLSKEVDKGTEIYISTGDFGSFLSKKQGKNWRMIHPPTHLHYFTQRSMTLMLQNEGFKVERFYYLPVWRSVKQIYFSLFILKKQKSRFHQTMYNLIPRWLFIPFNTFDIFIVKGVKE
jgi:2-polyprenyl-3-methyl-5-hydroxy-6-metoxy-1,4-benzoquinol methylase